MSLYEVLFGIVVVPAHNADGMRVIKYTLIGILRPVRAEVFPLLRCLVRPGRLCVYADRDTAVCQQLLFDRFSPPRIISIDCFHLIFILRRTGQNIGVFQSVRLIEPVFVGNPPVVVAAVAEPSHTAVFFTVLIIPGNKPALCLPVSSLIDQYLFIAVVQSSSVLQVRAYARGEQPGRVSRLSSHHLLRARHRDGKMIALTFLRVLRVFQ